MRKFNKAAAAVLAFCAASYCSAWARADYAQTFTLDASQWNDKPKSVSVAGTFNSWNKEANQLQPVGNNVWSGQITLPEGLHHYKFVIDNERYIEDPKADADLSIDDTFGGKNSGVIAGPDARKMGPAKPDYIEPKTVVFDPSSTEDVNVVSANRVRLRVRALKDDVERVKVFFRDREMNHGQAIDLPKLETTRLGYDVFGGVVDVPGEKLNFGIQLEDGTAVAVLGKSGFLPSDNGASGVPFTIHMSPTFVTPEWTHKAVWYQIFPERFRNGDKSNDPGDAPGERHVEWTSNWWDTQPGEAGGKENFYEGKGDVWQRRYGGDLQGLREKLPYLKSLGVTAIYLNPIFEAESMHKYDTADYRHVDDHFGVKGDNPTAVRMGSKGSSASAEASLKALGSETDDPATWKWSTTDLVFLQFVEEAHKMGFKVVLDGVFNHVGRAHPFFQDVLAKGKNSKYADWFDITDWGDEANWKPMADPYEVHGKPGGIQWKAWDKPNGALPNFKKDAEKGLAPGPYQHVMDITKRWLAPDGDASRGIDGWRLDVANDIPHGFWRDWRKVVKETKPDAYIAGEIWSPAQPWLQGDQFDAVMNYQFAMASQDFFVDQKTATTPSEFNAALVRLAYMYPMQAAFSMMNLFDSHDTDRAASMFVNPDRPYDGQNRLQDNGPDYSGRKPNETEWKKFKQSVAMQMSFLGSPMMYYGNEAGMWSPDDPSNRMPMVWEEMKFADPEVGFNKDVFEFHRRWIAVRHTLPALQVGDYFPVMTDDAAGVIVFGRRSEGKTVYVALNRSGEARDVRFNVPAGTKPLFNYAEGEVVDPTTPTGRATVKLAADAKPLPAESGDVTVHLGPYGAAVLAEI